MESACLSVICVSVGVQNTSFFQSAGGNIKSHLLTAAALVEYILFRVLGNAITVVLEDNFLQRATKNPKTGFHRTTVFFRACIPNQLFGLIKLSSDSIQPVILQGENFSTHVIAKVG